MSMTISHRELNSVVTAIALSGRVTLGQKPEQIIALVERLLDQTKRTIVFDLASVTAIDSTGIGSLIASRRKILAVGGEMRISGATGHLSAVFHVTRLDTIFQLYPTLEDAARSSVC